MRIKAESSDRGARVPPAAAIEATAMFNNALVPSSTNKLNDKLAYTCPGSDCWCLGFGSLLRPNISLNAPVRWIVYELNIHNFCIGLASVLGSKLHRNVPMGGSRRRPGGVRDALGRGVWKKHKKIYLLGPPRGHHFDPFGCSWVSFGRHFGVQIEFWTLFFSQ